MSVNRIISLCPVCSTKNSSSDRAFQHRVQYRAVNTDWTFLTCRTDHLNNFNLQLLGKPVIPTLLNGRCSSTPIFFSSSAEPLTSNNLCQQQIFQYKQFLLLCLSFTGCCTLHFHTVPMISSSPWAVSALTCRKAQIAKEENKTLPVSLVSFLKLAN